jgi:cyclophilin family peptidyl-prolyl cis-trans isomerase
MFPLPLARFVPLLAALTVAAALPLAAAPVPFKKKGSDRVVVLKTSKGTIKIELDHGRAPKTVANFLRYVDDRFYDGTVFHRVIPTFVLQGGGYARGFAGARTAKDVKTREKKTRDPIKNEAPNGLANERGTIAMARTKDLDSATAQFYINVEDNRMLDRFRYCVFGKVIEGMDVVDKIKEVPTKMLFPGFTDVPVEDVVIESVRRADR